MESLTQREVADLGALRVTVIDDHPEFLDMMAAVLGEGGHAVTSLTEGAPLDELVATNPDVLVVDLTQPHQRGIDSLRQLRAHPRLAAVPIVLCTAYPRAASELQTELATIGVAEVIGRPFEIEAMKEAIARATRASR